MKRFITATALIVWAALASTSCAQEIVDGELHVPERRIEGFVYDGADRATVMQTISNITTRDDDEPGSWVYEWTQVAEAELARAEAAADSGDREHAETLFFSAANYYAIAGFPEYHSDAERGALLKHFRAYERGGAFMEAPMQIVSIEARGQRFNTYFHRPAGIDRPPLILWTHGTDKFKGHAYKTVKRLLDRGFAVVTFDLAGTGENTFWNLLSDGEFVHQAVLDSYASRDDIDTTNIFAVGVSFGGHYAAKMAARNDPRLRAVASLCGPLHSPFIQSAEDIEHLLATEEGATIRAFAHRIGADPNDSVSVAREIQKFSLVEQGIMGKGEQIKTPLLIMNGGRDPLSPIADLQMLADSAATSELWIMGMAGHCARDYFEPAVTDVSEWLWQYASTE